MLSYPHCNLSRVGPIALSQGFFEYSSFKSYIFAFTESAFVTPDVRVVLADTTSPYYQPALDRLGGIKQAVRLAQQDRWQNPRVPSISMLPGYRDSDPFAWVPIDNGTIPPYSSLIGVPIRGVPRAKRGNATLTVQSSYVSVSVSEALAPSVCRLRLTIFQCGPWLNGSVWLSNSTNRQRLDVYGVNVSDPYDIFTFDSQRSPSIALLMPRDEAIPHTEQLPGKEISEKQTLLFATLASFDDSSRDTWINMTMCKLNTQYVDTAIDCTRASFQGNLECRATKMKHSQGRPVSGNTTIFTLPLVRSTLTGLSTVLANQKPAIPGGLDTFLQNPLLTGSYKVYDNDGHPKAEYIGQYWDLNVPMDMFEARLSIILNTFAMAGSNPDYISGAEIAYPIVTEGGATIFNASLGPVEWASSDGTWTEFTTRVYVVRWPWLALYVCAALVMSASAVANIVLRSLIRSPDFLNSVSALTRDSPFITSSAGGSALEGLDRARLMKNKRLMVRDVQPLDAVGRIALSDSTGAGGLDWDRKYA
jgi:hypothetical protein